jgi:hypothetical protein
MSGMAFSNFFFRGSKQAFAVDPRIFLNLSNLKAIAQKHQDVRNCIVRLQENREILGQTLAELRKKIEKINNGRK